MANIKSQVKRIKTNEKNRILNKSFKSKIKTYLKKYEQAKINKEKNLDEIRNQTLSLIDKAVTKKIFHANKAGRIKSRLMK